ncbi:alpha/beta fold hydrolase [Fodinicurvata halophila]|uniref:alpha/beta fold hydrolase n=1 Tax=Fodinicurvata halophila TaxID=1419723 RepID=UPI003630D8BB
MLHGYPQTHALWHKVAPMLAERFTVVASDLRGYGDSERVVSDARHFAYSKRVMALDQVNLMTALGYSRFAVAGHDRGARVAHRMALDHRERVSRLALLDIVPTYDAFAATDTFMATAYFHWFFLIQPFDFPERMIGNDPELFLRQCLSRWSGSMGAFAPEAIAEYLRCFQDPAVIHASCEDYRAAASVDLEHDAADRDRRIDCPLLVLWGKQGVVHKAFDPLKVWRDRAVSVEGRPLPCGHFLPEEAPEKTAGDLLEFFTR